MIGARTTLEPVRGLAAVALTSVGPETARSVLAALGDDFSERIVTSAVEQARTAEEISALEHIPLSTCYRRIRELIDSGLLVVERIIITHSGRRYAMYRSCFDSFQISLDSRGLNVQAELNKEVAEKVRERRMQITYATHDTEEVE